MGIRFACHACNKPLNIKESLAGKRGKCPRCGVRFLIPSEDREFSLRIEDPADRLPGEDDGSGGASDSGGIAEEEPSETKTPSQLKPEPEPELKAVAKPQPKIATQPAATAKPESAQPEPAQPEPAQPEPAQPEPAQPESAQPPKPVEAPFDPLADPLAQWYVRPNSGGQYGPADGPTVRQWAAEQRLTADTLLWRDGWPEWRSAGEVLQETFAPPPLGSSPSPTSSPANSPASSSPASASPAVRAPAGPAKASSAKTPEPATGESLLLSPAVDSPQKSGVSRPNAGARKGPSQRSPLAARQEGTLNATLSSASPDSSAAENSPVSPDVELSPASAAETYLGARRRRKQRQRVVLIGVLVAASLLLILALVIAIVGGPITGGSSPAGSSPNGAR